MNEEEALAASEAIEQLLDRTLSRWRDDLVIPVEAEKIVKNLRKQKPELLAMWLELHAEQLVTAALRSRLRNYRKEVRKSAGPRAFDKWRQDAIKNQVADPALLTMPYSVSADGRWKKLGDMTKEDLEFVISQREKSAAELQLEARFLRQLASRLEKGQTVAERWSTEELAKLADAA